MGALPTFRSGGIAWIVDERLRQIRTPLGIDYEAHPFDSMEGMLLLGVYRDEQRAGRVQPFPGCLTEAELDGRWHLPIE
ncbi:MAG: hypothetical protein KGJ23_08030 [Euryarchaeota archaeon]|nr:hypothetical protein [Euryarchaeota archaeon]MDE1836549.1 hypothetical protein [Euryarchaeota archaeon]MDE1879256.1 hypothetical protein [Euryarchaeota archaeon]MDE2044519.1 hypothetical protein [Thermoplasmata archaeon]